MEHIYDWITRIIDTCNSNFHFEAVDKIIDLFYEKYQDEKRKLELKNLRTIKWNEIHGILV